MNAAQEGIIDFGVARRRACPSVDDVFGGRDVTSFLVVGDGVDTWSAATAPIAGDVLRRTESTTICFDREAQRRLIVAATSSSSAQHALSVVRARRVPSDAERLRLDIWEGMVPMLALTHGVGDYRDAVAWPPLRVGGRKRGKNDDGDEDDEPPGIDLAALQAVDDADLAAGRDEQYADTSDDDFEFADDQPFAMSKRQRVAADPVDDDDASRGSGHDDAARIDNDAVLDDNDEHARDVDDEHARDDDADDEHVRGDDDSIGEKEAAAAVVVQGRGMPSDAATSTDPKYALERANPLPQFDGRVRLDESTHRYYVDGQYDERALSMTTWVAQCMEKFDATKIVPGMLMRGTAAERPWYAGALAAASLAWSLSSDADMDAEMRVRRDAVVETFFDGSMPWRNFVERVDEPTRTFIERHITEYASRVWKENGETQSGAGTRMHDRIEHFYRGVVTRAELEALAAGGEREYAHFLAFHDTEIVGKYEPVRMELLVFDTDNRLRLRGALDGVFRSLTTGKLRIIDWKRWRPDKYGCDPARLQRRAFKGRRQRAPLDHLQDCDFAKYSLQQSGYRYLIERYSDWRIDDGTFLAVFHPDRPSYVFEAADDCSTEIAMLAEAREREVASWST